MSTGFVVVIARKPEMQLRAAGQETGKESGSRGSCETRWEQREENYISGLV